MAYLAKSKGKAKPTASGKAPVDRAAKRWCQEIERYQRGSQKWRERAAKIEKIYLDEHRKEDSNDRRFAIVWANIETMKPATYARKPQAVVSRRWERDDAGRKASEVLERCINDTFDLGGIDDVMQCVRDDRLLTARGTAWVRYEAEFDQAAPEADAEDLADGGNDDAAEGDASEQPGEELAAERVVIEFVHWSDFGHTLSRTWPEVNAVWRVVYMTREKVEKHGFKNDAAAKSLKYEVRPELSDRAAGSDADVFEPQCKIHEIWDKASGCVIWLDKDSEHPRGGPAAAQVRNFWPCPAAGVWHRSTRSLIPVPDYRYYQDQAEEIDDLTAKISGADRLAAAEGLHRRPGHRARAAMRREAVSHRAGDASKGDASWCRSRAGPASPKRAAPRA
jgi:hypothetical protein